MQSTTDLSSSTPRSEPNGTHSARAQGRDQAIGSDQERVRVPVTMASLGLVQMPTSSTMFLCRSLRSVLTSSSNVRMIESLSRP